MQIKSQLSANLASRVMGNNFFGIDDWENLFFPVIKFTKQEREELSILPWDKTVLESRCPFTKGKKVGETHFAFLAIDKLPSGDSLTIDNLALLNRIHKRVKRDVLNDYLEGNLILHDEGKLYEYVGTKKIVKDFSVYYSNEKNRLKNQFESTPGNVSRRFEATETCRYRWYLMPLQLSEKFYVLKDPLRIEQTNKDSIPKYYGKTLAVEETLKLFLYFLKSRKCLYGKRRYAITMSTVRYPSDLLDHVSVGNYSPHDGPYFFFRGMERPLSDWDAFERIEQIFPDDMGVLCSLHLGRTRMPLY